MHGQVTPLRFEGDALLLLDQRALPAEERWLRCTTVEQVAEAIETLAVRGAPAIGVAAAYGLLLADASGMDVEAAAARLARTRPTAVNLRWALDRRRAEPARDPASLPRGARERSGLAPERGRGAGRPRGGRLQPDRGARRGAARRRPAAYHPLQRRRARHHGGRHGARRRAGGLRGGPRGRGVGAGDEAAPAGRPADGVGARARG